MTLRGVGRAFLVALLAALATAAAERPRLRLEPESATWRRAVRGTTGKGLLAGAGGLLLPALPRTSEGELRVEAEPASHGASRLALRVDGAAPVEFDLAPGVPARVALQPSSVPGLRIDLAAPAGALRLRAIEVRPGAISPLWPLLAALAGAGLALLRVRGAVGLGLVAGGCIALAAWFPLGAWLWPAAGLALVPALLVGLAGVALAWRAARARGLVDAALVAAFVFGLAVRLLCLHSTGSWDTEYWKAWMQRSAEAGVTRAYGPPEPFDPSRALRQLRGAEELWKVERGGRAFVVDYPPLSMALWAASWRLVERAAPDLPLFERENVAVKLPALAGDVLALIVLAWACAPDRRRALVLGALYWALPVSWLSSATLGYFDGVLPPLLLLSLVTAGRGRALACGTWLATATLVKPTALIAAPAVAVALWHAAGGAPGARRRAFAWATLAGLGVSGLVALPFLLDGTLTGALVHCARLFFQERLSGGWPNPWWLLGHALTAPAHGSWLGPVAFAPVTLVPFPVRPLGTLLFALGALALARRQGGGERAASRAAALLFLLYGLVGVGVHENHPHPLFLLLLFAGLTGRRLGLVAWGAALVYLGDMLALSGLGRFHGTRYVWLLPWAESAAGWRMALGVDLTLLLALLHLAVVAVAARREESP